MYAAPFTLKVGLTSDEQVMSIRNPTFDLGARVRELRHERGLTLKELGSEAGLSHPFLSQLERGLARPSMASVERIAHALDVPVSTLWMTPRRSKAQLTRAGEGRLAPHGDPAAPGVVRELPGGDSALSAREWSGGSRRWPDAAETESGELLLYVARGTVEIDLGGTVHTLGEGDALRFDGAVPHRLRRRGPVGTRALIVACA
jgi:transcriptional regulator with XRE-family HTH domain